MILDLEKQEKLNKAYNYAVFLLGIRLRTEGELREKLKVKKYQQTVIDEVTSRLKSQRFLDDRQFAEIFLDNLKKYKNFGYYGIKKKLIEKRLPASIIEQVLSEGLSEEEEMKIAERLLKRIEIRDKRKEDKPQYQKLRFGTGLSQKLAQKLRAKGFRSGVISKCLFKN